MLIDPSAVHPQPWRNGGGTTRELATAADSDGDLLWRVSIADLPAYARFSTFPGTDRVFMALSQVTLSIDGTTYDLSRGEQVGFDGEVAAASSTYDRAQALNVMVRRGAARVKAILRSPDRHDPFATVSIDLPPHVADVYIERTPHEDHHV